MKMNGEQSTHCTLIAKQLQSKLQKKNKKQKIDGKAKAAM